MEKEVQKNKKIVLKEWILTAVGSIMLAVAIKFFLEPNRIAGGGATGIAIILSPILNMQIGFITSVLNIILLIIGLIFIGRQFGTKTIFSMFVLSGALSVMDQMVTPGYALTKDLLLATIFGTLTAGVGMGIVFNQNASTGGTDIIAKIISKYVHFDIGKALLMVDFLVTLGAGAAFGAEIGMYSLLAVIITGVMIDVVIAGFNKCKAIFIISSKHEEINRFIIEELDRGSTILPGNGGYSGKETCMLYTVLSRKEFIRLKKFVEEIDLRAFITVSDAHEVLGEGFKNLAES